jgi:hypothetical protein
MFIDINSFNLILGDANPSGIEWNLQTQDLSNPSLLKIGWAITMENLLQGNKAINQPNHNTYT